MRRASLTALFALLLLGAPLALTLAWQPVFAEDGADADDDDPGAWKERLREAYDALDAAHVRQVVAQLEYGEMRHRRDDRGTAKAEIVAELEEAERELKEAERKLAELLEEARRAGVPPGTLREVQREREELADSDL